MTLKFENTANINDTIKAFDVEPMDGRKDKYIAGQVIDKGMVRVTDQGEFAAYTIQVTDSHNPHRIGEIMYVPFEIDWDDFDNRITKIN